MKDIFRVANKKLKSRLIVGTGKYKNFQETAKAVEASGADMVTVAVRRVNILDKKKPILTDYLNPKKIIFLPNTAGCCTYHAKTFKKHFADWKNHLTSLCSGDYIFQIDADEIPHSILIEALPEILESNPDNEVYLVPRVNTVTGIMTEHVKKWGWRLSNEGWVNWPDYQWRIWKNKPEIKWVNKVHEKLEGFLTYAPLPKAEQYALYHPKTIEKQEKQNAFYETI